MFDTLWDAIRDGTAADVRTLIAAGIPEEREEAGEPTPLMYAAALGHLDDVQALVGAGVDVNELAEHGIGSDLPSLLFLDELMEAGALRASMSALGFAAGYGREAVVAFLGPLTAADLRADAETIAVGRRTYLAGLTDKARATFLRKCEREACGGEAERQEFLRAQPKLTRWILPCVGCRRLGYLAQLPAEIDKRGTAAEARRLFRPLAADCRACERCRPKFEKARRDAEALAQKRLAALPPHVKVEVAKPKPRKKWPRADT